ncbi:MAG TPA: PAS domain-containing protein [Acetobacteraceae bacterium]|jgi:photoactive yellow protein|nr:PAS domain-containing protein [Acetobacteraceae bacterium]
MSAAHTIAASGGAAFTQPALLDRLEAMTSSELDALDFGAIAIDGEGMVRHYNACEARLAGLSPSRVLGHHLFEEVAPCMNNFMVSHRFEDEEAFDDTIPYVLTLRMRPTPVRLRLMKRAGLARAWVCIERRVA